MEKTLFSRMLEGEISFYKVYEDNRCFALLDIHPVQPGMVLVVPKKPVDKFQDLPDDDYMSLMNAVQKIAKHMSTVFPGKRIGVQIEGLDVPHTHVKLIPFTTHDEFFATYSSKEPDHEALAAMADKLKVLD